MAARASRCCCRCALPKSTDARSSELGVSFFSGHRLRTASGRTTTQQFAAPDFDDRRTGGLVFSDFLNLFFFNRKARLGAVIKALRADRDFQSLAEPNLIAYNGQEASFLAGGEIPVPVVPGQHRHGHDPVQGVRRPPELHPDDRRRHDSAEGDAGSQHARFCERRHASAASGFPRCRRAAHRRMWSCATVSRSPSPDCWTTSRRTTPRRFRCSASCQSSGNLFKSKAERSKQTELMVLITPRLVRPLNPDEVPPLPTKFKSFVPEGGVGKGMDGAWAG